MPALSGEFDLNGHHFACYMPASDTDPLVWTIAVSKDGKELRRETVPMLHAPIFGPDVGDIANRDARIEEIIKEMGLE